MSSLLKILVDVNCQVYCDYELIGEASPNSILRIELKKGNYILEFKQNDKILISQDYEMKSNDEECLLRVSLLEVAEKYKKDKSWEEIAKLNMEICRNYGTNNEVWLENKDTKEHIPIPYNVLEKYGFDECGLLNVNVGGEIENKEIGDDGCGWPIFEETYNGGRWGCVNKLGNVQIPIIYDSLIFFHSPHIAVAQLNDKALFIDKWNKIVFENIWDKVVDDEPFLFGKCIMEKKGNLGIIDENGNEILPLAYSKIIRVGRKKQFAVQTNGKWGLVDDAGNFLFPTIFDSIDNFYWSNSGDDTCFYIVSIGNKIGLIDCLGRVVFPIIYDEIKNLWNDIHVKTDIRVKKDNLYGLYHAEQQILPIKYDWIGLVLTRSSSKYDYCINASQNGCWGMYDSHGSLILPHDYDEINYKPTNTDEGFLVKKNGKYGYFSVDGSKIPVVYDSITIDYYDLKCLIVEKEGRFGTISTKGIVLLPIEYESIKTIERMQAKGRLLVKTTTGVGIYLETGGCVIEPVFDMINYSGGFWVSEKDGAFGLFSNEGDTLLPVEYEDIKVVDNGVVAAKHNGLWYLWNYSKNKGITTFYLDEEFIDPTWSDNPSPLSFNSFQDGHKNQLIIEKNEENMHTGNGFNYGNYAVFDYEKHKLIINNCDDIQKTIGDCYVFERCGKKGLYNTDGEMLYGNLYDEIVVREELIYAIQDGCYVIYDYDGAEVFEKKYKKEGKVYGVNGQCGERSYYAHLVTKDGKWGCLNYDLRLIDEVSEIKKVKEIVPCEYDYVAYEDKTLYTSKTKEWDIWDQHIQYFVKKEGNGDLHYYKYQCHESSADIIEDWIGPNTNARYLFIDTETTGLPKNRNAFYYDEDNWPYLVQISMIVLDSQMVKISEKDFVLKPEKYTIPQSASSIHGITNEYAQKYGKNRKLTLEYIRVLLQIVEYVIGHNVDFDMDVLKAEIYREWTGDSTWFDSFINSLRYNVIDTMKLGVDICKIPSNRPEEKYKWPTLDELYKSLFGKTIPGRHNAMNDVRATEECFEELRRRKLIK